MSLIPPVLRVLRNVALVTLTVVLGFMSGSVMGIPVWLQGFCLLPAAVLFYHLYGVARPPWWRMLGFFAVLSLVTYLLTWVLPLVPQQYQTLAVVTLVMLSPFMPVTRWINGRLAASARLPGKKGR